MISPNKFVSFSQSALGHVEKLYSQIDGVMTISELYKVSKKHFESIDLFMYTLVLLYLVDAVDADLEKGIVSRC